MTSDLRKKIRIQIILSSVIVMVACIFLFVLHNKLAASIVMVACIIPIWVNRTRYMDLYEKTFPGAKKYGRYHPHYIKDEPKLNYFYYLDIKWIATMFVIFALIATPIF